MWLGIKGLQQGRLANYTPSIVCGIIGIAIAGVSICFWIGAMMFFGGILSLLHGAAMMR